MPKLFTLSIKYVHKYKKGESFKIFQAEKKINFLRLKRIIKRIKQKELSFFVKSFNCSGKKLV